jgi:4-hydroxy-tetrahydrodipicolinate synthase
MYPVNAKYYLSLDGLDISYKCRAINADKFTKNRQMEIEQMHNLTKAYKEKYGF